MSDFDTLLAQYTEKGHAKVHGACAKCVDKHGNEIYSKISGYDSILPDAAPLREDCVIKVASATKLITSVALLQCVDKGLIGLDEPLTKIVPEFDGKKIVKAGPDGELIFEPSETKLTARHLLSHTAGLAYWFLNPLIMKWKKTPEGEKYATSTSIAEKCNIPFIYDPGAGWSYGISLDWAGVVIRRLHGGISLEDYMIDSIWKPLGLSAPYPTFHLSGHPEYKARLMQGAERTPDGSLKPYEFWQGENPHDQDGGHGMSCTMKDWLAVLADLVSDTPKLLKAETVDKMFEPQIEKGSKAMEMLLQLRPAWEIVAGPISNDNVNHGLGGVLVTGEAPEIGQPKNVLGWGGASNVIWFASREKGVAGFFATQLHPFGDSAAKELINAWKKDFWSTR